MYSYHNRVKQRIKNGELIGYEFTDSYRNIGQCLLLYFNTIPQVRPVRPYRYTEYIRFFASLGIDISKSLKGDIDPDIFKAPFEDNSL